MSTDKSQSDLNPRTRSYEFLGPPGALFITLAVPITTYALYFGCSEETGGCPPLPASIPDRVTLSLTDLNWWKGLWDTQAFLMYFAWYAFCVVAWAILPGDEVEGVTLRTGEKKKYKINGMYRPELSSRDTELFVPSILDIPACFGSRLREHLPLWSPVVHLSVREMGWLHHGVCDHVDHSRRGLLCCILPSWSTTCSWRKLRESHLRCRSPSSPFFTTRAHNFPSSSLAAN